MGRTKLERLAEQAVRAEAEVRALASHSLVRSYLDAVTIQADAVEALKAYARGRSVIGASTVLVDNSFVRVRVDGKKHWDPALVKRHLTQYPDLIVMVESVDTKLANALLDSGKISEAQARRVWVADTPAVTVKFALLPSEK